MDVIGNLEALVAKGQDNAILRYSLGHEYLRIKKVETAIEHLARAVVFDPDYSAAWKLYGKALTENNRIDAAIRAYEQGIVAAEKKGDVQAAREMKVFLKRLRK